MDGTIRPPATDGDKCYDSVTTSIRISLNLRASVLLLK